MHTFEEKDASRAFVKILTDRVDLLDDGYASEVGVMAEFGIQNVDVTRPSPFLPVQDLPSGGRFVDRDRIFTRGSPSRKLFLPARKKWLSSLEGALRKQGRLS